jgi:hypothetical protein
VSGDRGQIAKRVVPEIEGGEPRLCIDVIYVAIPVGQTTI